ncbi:Hem25 protein [Saccharomycopsis crataegensis]|uniref:Mitochondrial glycine transporter n=1 Tax=Saccharomycopsis crataegensis TaxID=43959 RepID=A0AAV5QJP8_9ASCO|nr:Hem25 protein [Saccharomycopsis crataegensis]
MSANKDGKSTSHLMAGFIGGLTSAVTLQPFDLLKTRVQQSQTNSQLQSSSSKVAAKSLRTIIKEMPSLRNLWTGTLPSVLRTSIGSSLYLTSLNISRNYLAERKAANLSDSRDLKSSTSKLPKLAMYENLISGAAMRSLVGILTMPITVIKTRYESSLYNYTSLNQAARDIFRDHRFKGFFLGCGSTIVRDAPYAGLYVLMYEQLKVMIPKALKIDEGSQENKPNGTMKGNQGIDYYSIMVNSMSAMTAASTATLITTPFDTIKTRIQIEPQYYRNFFHASKLILTQEGVLVLFRGAGLRLVRKTLSAGIAWGVYEELLKFF